MSGFDLYSGTSDAAQNVEVQHFDPADPTKPFAIRMRTPAVAKLTARTNGADPATLPDRGGGPGPKIATSTFVAPCHVHTCRRDPETGDTAFLNFFWVVPTGVGRSRFLLGSVSRTPVSPPRWLVHTFLNRFLDEVLHALCHCGHTGGGRGGYVT